MNRYNRQELIEGWDQRKIKKSSIAVVGSGPLANFTASSLVALGFGDVVIYDNDKANGNYNREFLLRLAPQRDSKVEALEQILMKLNPLVNETGVHTCIDYPVSSLLGEPCLIIDVTNNQSSKDIVTAYARKKEIPVISASADSGGGYLQIIRYNKRGGSHTRLLETYNGESQGTIPSGVLGGLITEEARKVIMPLNRQEHPVTMLSYSCFAPARFSTNSEKVLDSSSLRNKRALVIGAGALGNFTALGLALAGVGYIDIMDFDEVDTTNLNRQLLFYDAVGQRKAKALASKLRIIKPNACVKGLISKLDEHSRVYFEENQPDILLDCVDNLATRAIINYFAVRYGIPLVSGGTDPSSGQVVVYQPGKSACLDCRLGVDKALAKARTSHSCVHAAQPSVIMTNQIIGSLMAAETRAVLAPQAYGEAIKKTLKYDSQDPLRAGLMGSETACNCTRPAIAKWIKETIAKYADK